MQARDDQRYHHGDLRSALLTAALDRLEADGPSALSLRALARAVGVSPMAPYHHFKDRKALLAAVATAGFERLQQHKLENEAAHRNAREALPAGAANYVRFILANPNLYRLMQSAEFAERSTYPELHRAAAAPAGTLRNLIARAFEEHGVQGRSIEDCARMVWGLAHGIGTLALDGQISRDAAPELAQSGTAAMVEGWLNR
ncbi:TetR/AcrR family transcriptional regulator [Qipengyuania sp.]|uniref:TetR/AcrR family transcriptional regulator n=1 Tax=Qipengyuania sp. TaxID=2004515 RepID=UPI003BA92BA2